MTKPMPTGCIKQKELPSWLDFHILLETVDLHGSIRHLFIVDIFLMKKTLTKSNCSTMKFFHRSLKNKKLLTQMKDLHINFLNYLIKIKINQNHIDVLLNLMPVCFQKNFIPLYLEDLRFLIKRCSLKVTKVYTHFIFEQSCFKRGFLLNNQRKRQKVKTSIEKDFYKLMNNANLVMTVEIMQIMLISTNH